MSDTANVLSGCPLCGAEQPKPAARDESNIIAAVREVLDMDLSDPAQRGDAVEMLASALATIGD